MGGLLKEGSAFLSPSSSPRWQGRRAMAPACGTSCSRRLPMLRPGCSARRASSSCSSRARLNPSVLSLGVEGAGEEEKVSEVVGREV